MARRGYRFGRGDCSSRSGLLVGKTTAQHHRAATLYGRGDRAWDWLAPRQDASASVATAPHKYPMLKPSSEEFRSE